jgi:hypothetical protein
LTKFMEIPSNSTLHFITKKICFVRYDWVRCCFVFFWTTVPKSEIEIHRDTIDRIFGKKTLEEVFDELKKVSSPSPPYSQSFSSSALFLSRKVKSKEKIVPENEFFEFNTSVQCFLGKHWMDKQSVRDAFKNVPYQSQSCISTNSRRKKTPTRWMSQNGIPNLSTFHGNILLCICVLCDLDKYKQYKPLNTQNLIKTFCDCVH